MKRRLTLWTILLFAPLLVLLSFWMSDHSFRIAMLREQERVQTVEALVAPQIRQTLSGLHYDGVVQAARQYRRAYAAQGIELIFCYNGVPLGDAGLPGSHYDALLGGGRAAMLDSLSSPERYAVAEPLTAQVTMLLLRDVSDLYEMRDELKRTFLLAALGASALVALPIRFMAAGFLRPLAKLNGATRALALSDDAPPLPVARKDELGELARSFEEMRKAILLREEALQNEAAGRQALLDALAHEMRTPLCSLLGNARLLQRPLPQKERDEIAEDMAREIRRLSNMDGALAKLTLLRREAPEKENVPLLPLLEETAKRVRPQAEGVAVEVEGENGAIQGDRALLSLLADNLTVNALRASRPGQTVTLQAKRDGFTVLDRGRGMTQEQLTHAFEPFYKADKARTRARGGAGLGLTLCREIARIHGGEVRLVSTPGEGTRAEFTSSLQAVADFVTLSEVSFRQEVNVP